MGKIIKAVAVIAAVVAIAYFAPTISASLFPNLVGSAASAAAAAVGAGLTAIAGLALQAVFPPPSAKSNGGYAPSPAPTGAEPMDMTPSGFRRLLADPDQGSMAPIRNRWWRDDYWPWQRRGEDGTIGNCMAPVVNHGDRIVTDMCAPIRTGDLISFGIDDIKRYCREAGLPLGSGLIKRFIGIDTARAEMVVECLAPPQRIRVPLARLLWAYRIVGHGPTAREARQLAETAHA